VYTKRQAATVATLPRGRHKLAREEVRASQRERLLRGMLECVARDGFAATTVQKVAAAARVSPNTFYAMFEDKADCFLALCAQEADELLGELLRAERGARWVDGVRAGMRVYLRWWPAHPRTSQVYLVELPAAGGRALAHRQRTHERFVAMFAALAERARAEQPDLPPVSAAGLRVLVAGLTDLVAREVQEGRLAALPELEDELVALVVKTLA
jgi:AcrR family transcriptional regulator